MQARQKELEENRLLLDRERVELEQQRLALEQEQTTHAEEIRHRGDGGRAHRMARDVN